MDRGAGLIDVSWLRELLAWGRSSPRAGTGDELTDILAVCGGNVCRAPYITARLRSCLPGLRISSAGTTAVMGAPPADEVLRALARHGITGYSDVGRSLTRGLIGNARLVITAARIHRVQVVAMDRRAAGKTFTLKELARVVSTGPPVRGLDEIVARAAQAAQVPDDTDYDDDLDDPYGLGWPAYETMAADVDAALAVLAPALREGVPA
jgi:protein-tyrosine phosphatase